MMFFTKANAATIFIAATLIGAAFGALTWIDPIQYLLPPH